MPATRYLAFDLGAESGRAVLGTLDGGRLEMREVRRFPNAPLEVLGRLHWDVFALYGEIKAAMKDCAAQAPLGPESIGVDTWGVDFGLLARDGSLLGLPYSYRDSGTRGAMEDFFKLVPRDTLYEHTGIQFLPFNTLFQIYALVRARSPVLDAASDLLFMPDLFNYLLTGKKASEFTMATTSQILNPLTRAWNLGFFQAMGLSKRLMQSVLLPGTVLGPLLPAIADETGLPGVPIVATASHDTAAAVAAVPAEGRDWAYVSSGTWSLVGVEEPAPVLTPAALAANFTNEGGVGGTFRFLKNVTGLWLVNRCRKSWAAAGGPSYEELTDLASASPPFQALIDPDSPDFLNPPDMPLAIQAFCRKTDQKEPQTRGAIVRTILESLALKYRFTIEEVRKVARRPVEKIHVIGGGSRNRLLCRFTAEAAGCPVLAGPIEAASAGNILCQALALGHISSPRDIRTIVRESTDIRSYEPADPGLWEKAYDRFLGILRA